MDAHVRQRAHLDAIVGRMSRERMEWGIDRLTPDTARTLGLTGTRVGVLAHPASVDRELTHLSVVLARLGIEPTIVFGPEHGYRGEAQDMAAVKDEAGKRGAPVRSLYGDSEEALVPTAEDLDRLDVLLVDLQDVGARYYTFVWTAVLAMRAVARAGKRVVVLDRPNPIGDAIEGRSQRAAFRSFVGLEPIPIRHGLTLGEIVAHRAELEGIGKDQLAVLGTRGVARRAHATDWDRPFVFPSPNMPTASTALVYPGGCLLEGTNLSEGRGTTKPFEIFGAPFLDGERLAADFHALSLDGARVRPLSFKPMFHKFAGELCGGVEVHVVDRERFLPVATYVALIALAQEQAPERFRFRTERYEFVDDIPAFDLLTGDGQARAMILEGARPLDVAHAVSRLGDGDAERVAAARSAHKIYAA